MRRWKMGLVIGIVVLVLAGLGPQNNRDRLADGFLLFVRGITAEPGPGSSVKNPSNRSNCPPRPGPRVSTRHAKDHQSLEKSSNKSFDGP